MIKKFNFFNFIFYFVLYNIIEVGHKNLIGYSLSITLICHLHFTILSSNNNNVYNK